MPFRSEKQRRFLWAKHPEIAKRWAHEYPNQKNLPTYASDSDAKDEPVSKSAAAQALQSIVVNMLNSGGKSIFNDSCDSTTKKSNSKLEQIQMPQDEKPTYAGEKHINSILKPEAEDEGSIGEERSDKSPEIPTNNAENPLLSKLAVVLAPKIQQELENRRAEQEARMAKRIPNNANVKQYPVQSNVIPPPMGMTAPPQQAQPQQAQPQAPAQQPGQMAPVGGGNSPNANPINSFGGLSMNGDINGNAAFGTPNAAGGEKLGAQKCSCGCGDTTKTCKCPPSCSCRKEGGSCYGLTMKKAYHEALAKITGIGHQIHLDQDEQDELDTPLNSAPAIGAAALAA
ncbi:hypothetical protein EBT16_11710, partial [bacterium]|nr:hypothetical protein [bacterium]